MKIVLVRHGEPEFDTNFWVGVDEVGRSLRRYRDSNVVKGFGSELMTAEVGSRPFIMSSELTRAQDSARISFGGEFDVSELLNEAELPHPNRLMIPLHWSVLLIIYRVAWFFRYQSNADGWVQDIARANAASALLVNRAAEHGTVCAFGHGIMNRLIAQALKKAGWRVDSKTGTRFWGRTTLSK